MRFFVNASYTCGATHGKIKFHFRQPEMVEITHYFDLIGGKSIKMPKNGLEMGLKRGDRRVSLQTDGKSDGTCV